MFYDGSGNWVGPGPNPAASVGSAVVTPPPFDASAMPGYSKDWQNLISANSGYMSWKLSAAERADIAAANRRSALRSLAVRYGGLPSGFKDVYGDLSPGDLQVAAANPFSETQKLQRSYADSLTQFKRGLSARGALQSGDLGYGLNQADISHASDIYDLGNQFMGAEGQAVDAYGSTLAGLSAEQIQALRQAASDVYSQGYRLGGAGAPGGIGGGQDYMGIKGGQPAGNGEQKQANSASDLDTSGGWGVQWAGPGNYTPVKITNADGSPSNTVWVLVPGSGPAAPPAAPPPTAAPPAAPAPITSQTGYGGYRGPV